RPIQLSPKEAEYFIKGIGYERKRVLDPEWVWLVKVPKGQELLAVGKFKSECLSDIIGYAEPNYSLELRKDNTQK
ncbi:hypothetical protein HYX19_01075, partial [Candidatus Woesearchaeota archaeon]|nr:hypothetical protein [Candidatus Woesearchaeota archaeon]